MFYPQRSDVIDFFDKLIRRNHLTDFERNFICANRQWFTISAPTHKQARIIKQLSEKYKLGYNFTELNQYYLDEI